MKNLSKSLFLILAMFGLANAQQSPFPSSSPKDKFGSGGGDDLFRDEYVTDKQATEREQSVANSRLAGRPNAQYDRALDSLNQDIEIDLGVLRCDSTHLIEIQLKNQLGIELTYDQIDSSCGCVSGLPKDVNIEPTKSIPIRASFRVPSAKENFDKGITLLDSKRSVITRIRLKGSSEYGAQLSQDTFVARKPGRYTFETKVAFPLDKSDQMVFRFMSIEVSGWRLLPDGPNTGLLVFDIIIPEGAEVINSTMEFQVLTARGLIVHTGALKLIRGFKPATKPGRIILRKVEDHLIGRAIVEFAGLTEPGSVKQVKLIGTATPSIDGEEKQFQFEFDATLMGGKDLTSLAELKTADARILNRPNDFELSVLFSVGDETLRVPMSILKGETK
jgi:Protein of unknown function (DUF1573)